MTDKISPKLEKAPAAPKKRAPRVKANQVEAPKDASVRDDSLSFVVKAGFFW